MISAKKKFLITLKESKVAHEVRDLMVLINQQILRG